MEGFTGIEFSVVDGIYKTGFGWVGLDIDEEGCRSLLRGGFVRDKGRVLVGCFFKNVFGFFLKEIMYFRIYKGEVFILFLLSLGIVYLLYVRYFVLIVNFYNDWKV